jgi:hypothetical protein
MDVNAASTTQPGWLIASWIAAAPPREGHLTIGFSYHYAHFFLILIFTNAYKPFK